MPTRNGRIALIGVLITCAVIVCTTCFSWGITVGTVRQNKADIQEGKGEIRDIKHCIAQMATAVTILKTIEEQRAKGDGDAN